MRAPDERPKPSLGDIARISLWLGVAGFGGGYAVMQRVRQSVVAKRAWLSDAEFVDALGLATALPGTVATHVLTFVGQRFAGLRGAVVAAVCFLLPSFCVMVAFGVLYETLRDLHALATFLDGMAYATVGVVAAVAVDIGRTALRRRTDLVLAASACALLVFHVVELFIVVLGMATLGAIALRPRRPDMPPRSGSGPQPQEPSFGPVSMRAVLPILPWALPALTLFTVFAKIGLVTFGGGFAMIPALEREAVHEYGWLTESAFNDAMVLGQVTPGPVAIVATFIGYRVAHFGGALLATFGMFGPPFVVATVVGRSAEKFRDRPVVRGALRAITPAVVGIIASSAVALWRTTVHSPLAMGVAAATFVLLVSKRTLSPLVPLALAGLVVSLVR